MTDSNTEIPYQIADQYNIPVVLMPYTLEGQEYFFDLGRATDFGEFYRKLKAGSLPTTSMLNPDFYIDFWKPFLEAGQDILFICFSSKLSGTFALLEQVRETALAMYPGREIRLVDTRSISMGGGLLVYYSIMMREAGKTMDEIANWVEANRDRVIHLFMVNDLQHLKRGGRIAGSAAMMGTILDVKPILTLDHEGRVVPLEKIKGRRKAVKRMLEIMRENIVDQEEQICAVLHADSLEEGEQLQQAVQEEFHFKEVWLRNVGPVIGTHAGTGTLALIFMGRSRFQ